jgi:hypothetical protein
LTGKYFEQGEVKTTSKGDLPLDRNQKGIPSINWIVPDSPFVSNDYNDGKSEPEWGIYVNEKHFGRLENFAFEKMIKTL